ncbi:MAG TPA: tRNA (adenosine(37)-N6)-dimethylallyltransferase MiaA [Candidatus Saccharimonadales bacterium]|jgi:tRNA dimethylallyltransferase|nr:tRNA (adenosine(37)-N6)-dimethylallyltransferase MiaA [Candidatus Saccharimonadales bacterium]
MESQPSDPPLIVIVGQTASGKSALALDLAGRWNGEVIAADSRTIYKGMDIGTAKPSLAQRKRVRHHLLNVTTPDKLFTASDFKHAADKAIADIASRGKLPFLVGGTGLYIDSVLFDFSFRGVFDAVRRKELERLPVSALQAILTERGIALPANEQNPRHLIRAVETEGQVGVRHTLRPNTLIMGLAIGREELRERVTARMDAMLAAGLEHEVLGLAQKYGWDIGPMQTIGYQEFEPYIAGNMTIGVVRDAIITHTMQYSKRQKTWFSRNKGIHWISKTEEAVELLTTFLNK